MKLNHLRPWTQNEVFYHIYPLGLLGAEGIDNPEAARLWRQSGRTPNRSLSDCRPWIDHATAIGCTALYLGPLFQSGSHGYDTIDFQRVDDRIGSGKELKSLVEYAHHQGMKVILDAVLNHVGRDFPAFRNLRSHTRDSEYRSWFHGIDFNRSSPFGDTFSYTGWNGHYDLVKLDLSSSSARKHVLNAVHSWIEEYDIDGLRLDAADCLSRDFIVELSISCRKIRPHFHLLGELVHGDYRQWVFPDSLDSATNYEAYKGLWSSFNDGNFFEIAWTLNRQFGPTGIYKNINLFNFVDNHDVNRIASTLQNTEWLGPLYCLLFTMPGTPSLYYGSEWGITGKRLASSDAPLRPALALPPKDSPLRWDEKSTPFMNPGMPELISKLARIRRRIPALSRGEYHQVFVSHRQMGFARTLPDQMVLVLLNSDSVECRPDILNLPAWMRNGSSFPVNRLPATQRWIDLLDKNEEFVSTGTSLPVRLPPNSARILLGTGMT